MIDPDDYRVEVDDGFVTVTTHDVPTFQIILGQPTTDSVMTPEREREPEPKEAE